MKFGYTEAMRDAFPAVATGVIAASGIRPDVDPAGPVTGYWETARHRLTAATEGEFPEIQAWRRAFSAMGLKPTQYRCAAEALLRRFRKEDALPSIHPLIDLCNAASLAFAIPVAVFDRAQVDGDLTVRHAAGDETYLTFGGETETPAEGEVIFADGANNCHARRWTNRQSARSAIRPETADVLIVAEALHDGAHEQVADLVESLTADIGALWSPPTHTALLPRDGAGLAL